MISVQDASETVLSLSRDWGVERVPLEDALGRVLAESIISDRPMPPFDRVTMDGIACRYEALSSGKPLRIEDIAPAGAPQKQLTDKVGCIEVMTGAIVPAGCDTIVRYEDLEIVAGYAHVQPLLFDKGQNIHRKGSDRHQGSVICLPYKIISPAEINVLATVGHDHVSVKKRPKALVGSTGDELVPIASVPLSHQIRRSNDAMLRAALMPFCSMIDVQHIPDDPEYLTAVLGEAVETYDCLILSGGVSAGKYDYIPETLRQIGVKCHFHKVAQRPGKPLWLGSIDKGPVVFALPGNPASSFLCLHRYTLVWLKSCLGIWTQVPSVILDASITFTKPLTYFAQVRIENRDGKRYAYPILGNGSGDLANLVDADGFVEMDASLHHVNQGDILPFYGYRGL